MKLILFDIDKTLIKKMALRENPWKQTFEKVFALKNSTGLDGIDTQGKTHKYLAVECMKKNNIPDKVIEEKLAYFLEELEKIYEFVLDEGIVYLFDKIEVLLETLADRGFKLGLVTGNTKNIAFYKLRRAGIERFFNVGGFGDDGMTRSDLVKVAVDRAKKYFGTEFLNDDIFIIGDTPLDITSAKEHSLRTIGVATGFYSMDDLYKVEADYVLGNLEDIDKIVEIVSG